MVNSKIINTLQLLGIPIYWMEYDGDDKEYIIFKTSNVNDIRYYDDCAGGEQTDIGIIYWFNSPESTQNIDKIKVLMKTNGFIKLNESDMKDQDYYGRSFRFRHVKDL